RLLCFLHKSEEYGCFSLKQKYKQSDKQVENFASALVRPLALSFAEIRDSLIELLSEQVLFFEGEKLCQKRMIKDAKLSESRAKSGRRGGKQTAKKLKNFAKDFAKPKTVANTEYEIENENEYKSVIRKGGLGE